jgi:hypothetical protein
MPRLRIFYLKKGCHTITLRVELALGHIAQLRVMVLLLLLLGPWCRSGDFLRRKAPPRRRSASTPRARRAPSRLPFARTYT